MNRNFLLASGVCLLALTVTCRAAEPVQQNFECDTLPGHFAYWNRTVTGAPISISGKLAVNELRKDAKWTPTANVALQGGTDGRTRFGVHLFTVPKVANMYFLEIVKPSGNEKLGLGLIPSTQDPIPFSLSLDASGQLHVSMAGLEASTSVGDFKPSTIEFACSTGDFEFRGFVVDAP